ncbi:MAG TPA: caspase family protein [Spirochaetales bacterium]|nr:caspase family protein [Spirochaetales bacterium]
MKHLLAITSLCLCLACACSMPEIKGTAIVLGVSLYNITDVTNLTYCDDDARDIAKLFDEQGYRVYSYIDSNATRANLEHALELADKTRPVVVYYSGHGLKLDFSTDGVDPGFYMLPYGFAVNPGTGLVLHRENMLAISDIEKKARELSIKHCIVIADCCYSGGFVDNMQGVSAIPRDYDPVLGKDLITYAELMGTAPGRFFTYSGNSLLIVLAASGSEEMSFESGTYENGVFTEYFLSGASTNADSDRDGYITTSEIYLYVAQCMNKYWNSTTQSQSNTKQIYLPHISDNAREYILFKAKP